MKIVKAINECRVITPDRAKLILRLAVGGLVLLHGLFKLSHPAMVTGFIAGAFMHAHLPGFLAYLVYVGEVIAPIMLLVGYQTKIAALLVAIDLLVAILIAHMGQIFMLGQGGGAAIELQLMYLLGAVAIFGLGAEKYTLWRK